MAFSAGIGYNGRCKPEVAEKNREKPAAQLQDDRLLAGNGYTELRRDEEERYVIWPTAGGGAPPNRADPGAIRRGAVRVAAGGEQMGERAGLPGDGEDHLHLQPLSCDAGHAVCRGSAGGRSGGNGGDGENARPAQGHLTGRVHRVFDKPVPQEQVAGRRGAAGRGRPGGHHRPVPERRKFGYGDNDMDRGHHRVRRGGGRHRRADIHLVRAGQRGRSHRRRVRRAAVVTAGAVLRGVGGGAGGDKAAGDEAAEKGHQAHQRRPGTGRRGTGDGAH